MTCAAGASMAAFALASLALAATPGPGVAYIATRTITQGRIAGLASVAGVALGNLGNALAASLGLAAVVLAWPWAFGLIKLAGAVYLIGLGVQSWRAPVARAADTPMTAQPPGRIARAGALVALLNPKTALFFVAFLPQFVGAGPGAAQRSVVLGVLFVAIAACTDTAYVLAAHAVAGTLQSSSSLGRWAQRVTAFVYVALGVLAAVVGWHQPS